MFECITLTHLGDSQWWGGVGEGFFQSFKKLYQLINPAPNSLFYGKAACGGPVHVSESNQMYFLFPSAHLPLPLLSLSSSPEFSILRSLLSLKKTTQSPYSLWSVGNSIQPVFTFRGDEYFTQRNDSLMVKFSGPITGLMGLSVPLKTYNTGDYWWWGHRAWSSCFLLWQEADSFLHGYPLCFSAIVLFQLFSRNTRQVVKSQRSLPLLQWFVVHWHSQGNLQQRRQPEEGQEAGTTWALRLYPFLRLNHLVILQQIHEGSHPFIYSKIADKLPLHALKNKTDQSPALAKL